MKDLITKNRWPIAIFLTAFLIRLIYILQSRSNPAFYFPMVDEQWHLLWARDIITKSFWGTEAYFRGPLYPYFLALLIKITGDSILWSRLLQIIIPSLSAALIFLIGERSFSRKIGIIAGFGFAIYGTMIFYDAMFLLEVLFIFLILLTIYLMIQFKGKSNLKLWLPAGFILGLATITRPNILLVSPLFIIWLYLSFRSLKDVRRRLLISAVYLAGLIIAVLPVTVRNYIVTGEAIFISSQGGVNFYIGNNPDADGLTMLMPEVKLDESLPWTEFTAATREAAQKEAGRSLTTSEESSFWTSKTIKFITGNPGKFLSTTFRKLIYLTLGFENSDNVDIYFSRNYSSLYSILLWHKLIYFPFGLLLPLAAIGIIEGWKRRRELALFYLFIIGYIPTVILFLVTARHRLPLVPFLLLFAVSGALALWDYRSKARPLTGWKKRDIKKVIIFAAIFPALLIFCNRNYFDIGFQNTYQIHFNLGMTYERQGNIIMAEKEYRAALESNPYSATILNNLGFVLYRQRRYDEAMFHFNKAIQSDPKFAEAYNNIGLIYESRNDPATAEGYYKKAANINPDLMQAYLNLGDIYLAGNDYVKAEVSYLQARQVAPADKAPCFKLGAFYGRMKELTRAEEMFTAGSKLGEPGATDYINWGNIYYGSAQFAKAIELYKKGIAKDSTFAQGYYNLAAAYQSGGYPGDSARVCLEKLLRINPQFTPARELLQRLRGN